MVSFIRRGSRFNVPSEDWDILMKENIDGAHENIISNDCAMTNVIMETNCGHETTIPQNTMSLV